MYMFEPMTDEQWRVYYDAMANTPPRETLLTSLALFDNEALMEKSVPFAIDLGCGEGRDTVELLRRGWRVLAIDGQEEAIRRLRARPDLPAGASLETNVARYEEITLPESALLVNASFALPFCPPKYFPTLWGQIVEALPAGGRFSGQLFGDRDGWAGRPAMTHHSRADVEALLSSFDIERFDEEERDGTTTRGGQKHWHVFHLVAQKR
jgi:tellurite methyltransferase